MSTHVSLREACDRVKKQRVLDVIRIGDRACREMGIENPRIAVAGLNPHSGEHGLFGQEEIQEIIPAIEAARAEGIQAEGPVPPDTVFSKARGGWYDIVVAMYHDQGQIALKLKGFDQGITIAGGLPAPIVTCAHGTAYDIAGKGIVKTSAFENAVKMAAKMAAHLKGC